MCRFPRAGRANFAIPPEGHSARGIVIGAALTVLVMSSASVLAGCRAGSKKHGGSGAVATRRGDSASDVSKPFGKGFEVYGESDDPFYSFSRR